MSLTMTEHDGRSVMPGRDPPGQRSTYILPGDTEREVYRLITYAKFPQHVPVNACLLAAHGFYYTGYKDRAKCFSCGRCIQDWTRNDDPSSPQWHDESCDLVRGVSSNIPIANQRNTFRTPTPDPPPSSSHQEQVPNPVHESRVPAGMALMEGVRTASGSFQTARVVSPQSQQVVAPPSPQVIPPLAPNEVAQSPAPAPREDQQDVSNQGGDTSSRMALFPCQDPAHPHMRDEGDRLRTYTSNLDRWGSQNISASPRQFAQAGLYYLGMGDRVKCWYCNGGLQNWRRDDDPWTEHTKWFPTCEFVLQQKGLEFVENTVARFPDLNRPTPVAPTRRLPPPPPEYTVEPGFYSPHNNNSRGIEIIDPREEQRKLKEKVDQMISSCGFISEASTMGFSEQNIRAALERNFEENRCKIENLGQLVEDILAHSNMEVEEQQEEAGSQVPQTPASSSSSSSVEQCVEELHRLEEERRCKKCHRENACVVLLPCGHLACCRTCGENVSVCPMCKGHVSQTVRSYIA